MTVDLLGIRLALQLGPTLPLPAPSIVGDALRSVEVHCGYDSRDTFQLTFAVARDTPIDASLIGLGLLEPPNRMKLTLIMGVLPEVLIDGIITRIEFNADPASGGSLLYVSGEDLSVMMDLEEQNRSFSMRPDSVIVQELLLPYAARYQIVPQVTQTFDIPLETDTVPSQQGTDLQMIRRLAKRNGFVFFVEPQTPLTARAYWGPDAPTGAPQPAVNLGFLDSHRASNGALNGSFDGLASSTPAVTITEPTTGVTLPVEIPPILSIPPTLRAAPAMRRTIARTTTGLDPARAALTGVAQAAQGSPTAQLKGEVNGVRYGRVLRSRQLVGIRGMGLTWDGLYTVNEVTHKLRAGAYTQSFALKRGGFVSATPVVVP